MESSYLSRRLGETIVIDGTIEVTVMDVRAKTVKRGIQSPESTTIHRQEVLDKIRETNAAARVDAEVVKRVLGG